jgi:hypothetical protein
VTSIVVAMIVILVVVACTLGLVLLGIEGRGKQRAPKLADRMARAAQHLNGDGEPPARLIKLIESTAVAEPVGRPSFGVLARLSSLRE